MARLENKTIEKLEEEGRITHIPLKEACQIQKNTRETRIKYYNILAKRNYASHQNYKRVLV